MAVGESAAVLSTSMSMDVRIELCAFFFSLFFFF